MCSKAHTIGIKGEVVIFKLVNGKWVKVVHKKNTITASGIAEIAKLIAEGLGGFRFGYIAIGTGTTPPSINDTKLENEIDRKPADIEISTTNVAGDTLIFSAIFSPKEPVSITEAGIFNSSIGGTMLCRAVFDAVEASPDSPIKVEWHIVFTTA